MSFGGAIEIHVEAAIANAVVFAPTVFDPRDEHTDRVVGVGTVQETARHAFTDRAMHGLLHLTGPNHKINGFGPQRKGAAVGLRLPWGRRGEAV